MIYSSLGETLKALDVYSQALGLRQAMQDPGGEAATLHNIGRVYSTIGEVPKALEYYTRVLPILRRTQNRPGEAITLSGIGRMHDELGDQQKALEFYNQALPLLQAVGDADGQASTLNNIGSVSDDLGDKQKALAFYEQALALYRQVKNQSGEAITLNNIAGIYGATGNRAKSQEYYGEALLLIRRVGGKHREAVILGNIGFMHETSGDVRQALDFYLQSIEASDYVRGAARLEEFKIKLAEQSVDVYQRAILLHLKLRQPERAFELSEQARARAFLDQLSNARVAPHKNADAKLVEQEKALRLELGELESNLQAEQAKAQQELDVQKIRLLDTQLKAKLRQYEDLLTRFKISDPEYATLRSVNTLTLPGTQRLLKDNTTLLSYYVGRDETIIFVITRASFQAIEVKVKEADLRASVNLFRNFDDLNDAHPESLTTLYNHLIEPVRQYVRTAVVGIVPHRVLHYLPFAALSEGRNYFGEGRELFTLPSVSVLPIIERKRKPRGQVSLLALAQSQARGFPLLQFADAEATTAAKLYGTEARLGSFATESAFRAAAGDNKIVMLAAHGEFNAFNPLFSRVLLAPDKENDGSLQVYEIYQLELHRTDLVVLSACQTQLGARSRGDDIVGLSRAFIYAGSPSVIASLWTVDDKASGVLMNSFYQHLKRGMSKAAALAAAQRETRATYPNPFYWAAFILTGDPGAVAPRGMAARRKEGTR
jgi:CHAT domain-containing protein